MDYQKILECIKQKKILLEKVMEISSRMESLSKMPHPDPENLPLERQVYIDRLKKCEQLIADQINQLSSNEQTRIRDLLSSSLKKADCTAQELELWEYGNSCRTLLRSIIAADQVSMERFREESQRLQQLVNQSRSKQSGPLFYDTIR